MVGMRLVGALFIILSAIFTFLIFTSSHTRGVWVFLAIEFIVLGLIFVLISRAMYRGLAHAAQLQRDGALAEATIVSVADTGVTINDNPRVKMQLHVVPVNGDPFDVNVAKVVSRVAVPRPGEVYKIRYNLTNPQDFVFASDVGASSATLSRVFISSGAGEQKVADALNDPAVAQKLAQAHNADEAKDALRSILGAQVDNAKVTFQVNRTYSFGKPPSAPAPTGSEQLSSSSTQVPSGAAQSPAAQARELLSTASDAPASIAGAPTVVDQLAKLEELREKGAISDAEYQAIKQKFLTGP